ncbi:beta-N-acetylhexosaminidase [Bacillus sp. JCM 19041]|uniref:beta-N-acetylhexosaminidase n=1 Tax=Bacillus sp. JCM 19041 TaxID=1460637 RepID=UPI0009EBA055
MSNVKKEGMVMNEDQRRKLGQLFVFGFNGTTVTPGIKQMIQEHFIGNIILFSRNIKNKKQLFELTTQLQRLAKEAGHERPLAICVDQENGAVRRLGDDTTMLPGAMLLGATNEPSYAKEVGKLTAKEMTALGVNWNLAPVVDINNNPENPVIGVRSFGENPVKVAAFSQAIMQGMQDEGVMTTLKHFPGHGDTNVDSHHALPIIEHSSKRLFEVELVPFQACIKAGADMVMSAHVVFPAFESNSTLPATLSKQVITDLLRQTLGFDGVVVTDCLEMDAIAGTVGTAQGAFQAFQAGADLLMVSHRFERQQETIDVFTKKLVTDQSINKRLEDSYKRVIQLKERYLTWAQLPQVDGIDGVGSLEHRERAASIYEKGITAIGERRLDETKPVLVFYPETSKQSLAEDPRKGERPIEAVLDKQLAAFVPIKERELDRYLTLAASYEQIIVASRSMEEGSFQQIFIRELVQRGHEPIVIGTQNPYDYGFIPENLTYVSTYEHTEPAIKAAFNFLYEKGEAQGVFPVTMHRKGGGVGI